MRKSFCLSGGLILSLPTLLLAAVIHEQLPSVPAGWAHHRTPNDAEKITLEIALAQSNITEMITALYSVSTPGSSEYGKYWSGEAVATLIGSSDEAKLATTSWLKDAGIENIHQDGNYIKFSTTIGAANKLLDTNFHYYQNNGAQKLRITQYSVSEEVSKHIEFIHPTTFFGKPMAQRRLATRTKRDVPTFRKPVAAASTTYPCAEYLSQDCLRELYNVPLNYRPKKSSGASLGFGSFLNQSAIYSDLFAYEKYFGIPSQNFTKVIINGGINDQNPDDGNYGEADLDVENIVGMAHPLPVTEFLTGGSPPYIPDDSEPAGTPDENEPYLPYYQYLLKKTNEELPQSISNSYGDDEQTVPLAYAKHVCNLIGMMGLRGITILESSGDLGVGAGCTSNKGKDLPRFNPIFPATCPYLTAVGGTQGIPDIAWVGSSGGFSDYFPRPNYQETAVNTYLNKHVKATTAVYFSAYTNFGGRGFPDLAAASLYPWYLVFYAGELSISGGTSAAAPVVNAIVGLLNAALLNAGKPTLGWLNPWLYSGGYQYLRDITGGQSIGCNGNNTQTGGPQANASIIPYAFWNATKGWDPVTGWGVPDFESMLAAVLAMPT